MARTERRLPAARLVVQLLLLLSACCSDSDDCDGIVAGNVLVRYGAASHAFLSDIAVDSDNVYWLDKSAGTIRRIAKLGGTAEAVADTSSPVRLATDTDYVYWINQLGGVQKVLKTGGPISPIATDGACPFPPCGDAIAVDQDTVYWVNETDTGRHLMSAPKSGGAATELSAPGLVDAGDIVVDEQNVYWMSAVLDLTNGMTKSEIRRTPKNGGTFETVAALDFLGVGLVGDSTNVYIARSDGIWRIPKDASGPVLIVNAVAEALDRRAVATDGSNVYVLELSRLLRVAVAGGDLEPIACNSGSRGLRVAMDEQNAYWIDEITSAILFVPK